MLCVEKQGEKKQNRLVRKTGEEMRVATKRMDREDLQLMMEKERIRSVIMIDGETKIDRKAMRELVKSHGVELLSPRAPLVIFKVGGNLIGCDDEDE